MSPKQLATALRVNLFADRGTDLNEAMHYSSQVLNSLGAESIAARTAMHVVRNTVANTLESMPDPADHPAVGVEPVQLQMDRNALDAIIDARIEHWMSDNLRDEVDERVEHWMDNNFDAEDQVTSAIENLDLRISIR